LHDPAHSWQIVLPYPIDFTEEITSVPHSIPHIQARQVGPPPEWSRLIAWWKSG
jgi:hypothetical protein